MDPNDIEVLQKGGGPWSNLFSGLTSEVLKKTGKEFAKKAMDTALDAGAKKVGTLAVEKTAEAISKATTKKKEPPQTVNEEKAAEDDGASLVSDESPLEIMRQFQKTLKSEKKEKEKKQQPKPLSKEEVEELKNILRNL